MSRGVQRCKVDANHGEIVAALRKNGMVTFSTAALGRGFPDLVVGFMGINILLEVKDGTKSASERKLTEDEAKFINDWAGQVAVVTSAEEAVETVIATARRFGVWP